MSRVYDFYRTPSQEEIEEQERLEYLQWYQEQNEKQKEDENTISDK
jgi:hypothetical protein